MINFIIGFIVGAMLMMCAIGLMSCQKDKKPRNKVRFFVTCDKNLGSTKLRLWLGRPKWSEVNKLWVDDYEHPNLMLAVEQYFNDFNLNKDDFRNINMITGGIREVFLNLED